jgi:uncharacterized protein involved in exopolysaccharide biosynthesis
MTEQWADDFRSEEREIDMRAVGRRILRRWWLVLAGIAVGVVVGVVAATSGGQVFRAGSLLYLGSPFASGGQVQTLATHPAVVREIIGTEAALEKAAQDAGTSRSALRGKVTTELSEQAGSSRFPLVTIVVHASTRDRAEKAADSLAATVIGEVSAFVDNKIGILDRRAQANRDRLARYEKRIAEALADKQSATTNSQLPLSDRLLIQANANATLQFYEARSANLSAELFSIEQQLSVARNVERSRIVENAVARLDNPANRRVGGVIGGIIGLLVGAVVAAAWDPARRKLGARAT